MSAQPVWLDGYLDGRTLDAYERRQDREALERDPDLGDQPPSLAELLVLEPISAERLAQLRAMDYRTGYLRSPEWQDTRLMALAACGRRCQRCDQYKGLLDVHHLSYERLGAEEPDDLIVLCRRCHRQEHG